MQHLTDLLVLYYEYVLHVVSALWRPGARLWAVYVLSAIGIAYLVYRFSQFQANKGKNEAESKSFVQFLVPRQVWSHPSAWLDVRFYFFHHFTGVFLMVGVLAGCTAWSFALVTGGESMAEMARLGDAKSETGDYIIAIAYMVVFIAIGDFIGFVAHYLQHKVPILWEFHKVHHSAEVMHPMSNFREHPIDNLLFKVSIGTGYGVFIGLATMYLGYLPNMPSVFGVPVLMFLFNFLGYNLRHSHVWLRWPGVWSKVFPSPAHHQVHHSSFPEHFDKNFAFMFPVWDVIFGTYIMPEDNKDVKFGVAGMKSNEMDTCTKLYLIPFKKAFKRLKRKGKTGGGNPQQPAE